MSESELIPLEPRVGGLRRATPSRPITLAGDGVVLGCTEIPLIIDDGNSPLPTFDTTRLLVRASLKYASPAFS